MTREEMIRLFKQLENGTAEEQQEALEILVQANIPLAKSIVKAYPGNKLPPEDLLQEATVGLIKAVRTFDPAKGYAFSTHATTCINNAIKTALAMTSDAIRIKSTKLYKDWQQLKHVGEKLSEHLDHSPTEDELAAATGFSPEYVRKLRQLPKVSTSIDRPIGDDDGTSLGDLIPDSQGSSTDDIAVSHLLREDIQKVLCSLMPDEAEILRLRFGLEDNHPRSIEHVAALLNMPKERVYDISVKALRKLWHPSRAKKLN